MKKISDYQIIGITGGMGKGLLHRTRDQIPKCLLKIGDKTLIDYYIELYSKHGCKDFIFLLGHLGEQIQDYIENSSNWEIKPRFSIEKEALGKGGALKYALETGIIDRKRACIIHYPDDLILYDKFPIQLIRRHLEGVKKGALATLVKVGKTRYRYGSPESDVDGFVVDFEEKPWVTKPAGVGVYVLQPDVYRIIDEKINLKQKPIDFEPVIIPELIRIRALYEFVIPYEAWIPVNDEKEFQRAEQILLKKI